MGKDNREMGFSVANRLDNKNPNEENLHPKLMFIWPLLIYSSFPILALYYIFESMSRMVILRNCVNKPYSVRCPCYGIVPGGSGAWREFSTFREGYLEKSCLQQQSLCIYCSAS